MKNKKFKMTIDFYKYLFFLKKREGISLIINLLIFLISLITAINDSTSPKDIDLTNFFVVIILLFSLFNVIWETVGKLKDIQSFIGHDEEIEMTKKEVIIKENLAFKLGEIKYIQKKSSDFETIKIDKLEAGYVIRSIKLNQFLWNNNINLEIDTNKKEKVKKFILKNKEIIAPFFQYQYYKSKKNQQYFFNDYKFCMASDLYAGEEAVRCYKSDYYSSFLTNEICMSALKRIEDATIIYDASNFYPCEYKDKDKTYYLQPVDKSEMNNHIGVSTLAITKDNYIVLRKQNKKSQQNKNKFVPTGSGSCDWSDIRGKSFTDTIEYAMKRELWEENGSKKISPTIEEVGQTKVLGFYRWLERGGKPEFVGITKLNCNFHAMEVNTEEFVDITNRTDMDTYNLDDIDNLPEIIEIIKDYDNISIPLYMCLDALEVYYKEHKDELAKLLM